MVVLKNGMCEFIIVCTIDAEDVREAARSPGMFTTIFI